MAVSVRWMVSVVEGGRIGIEGADCGETGLNILCENSGILWDVILILCKNKKLITA